MQKEDDLKDYICKLNQPIDTFVNHVNRLVNLCELVQDSTSDRLKENLSYKILSKHNAFMDSLKTWNRRTSNLKTYTLMKTFILTGYNNLEKVGGITIARSNLSQANIIKELKQHQEEMSARMEQDLKTNKIETLTGLCGKMKNKEKIPPQQEMNSANNMKKATFGNDDSIYQLLTGFQNKVKAISNNNSNYSFAKTPSSDTQGHKRQV